MFLFQSIAIIIIISSQHIVISYGECTFQLFKDMDPHFQPIYFVKDAKKKSYTLATQKLIKTRNYIIIDESETLIITCPNEVQQSERYYEIDIFLVCGKNQEWTVTKGADKIPPKTEISEYKCKNETGFYFKKETNEKAKKPCKSFGKGYQLHHVGIFANLTQKWLRKVTQEMFNTIMTRKITYLWFTLYTVCSAVPGQIPEYTHYTIDEERIINRQMKSTKYGEIDMRNPFETLQLQFNMFSMFNKENIYRKFDRNYRGKLNSFFNVENHHFIPVALVPENSMSFSSWRYATHLTMNIVPVWKQLSCTWKTIENVVKLAAIQIGSTLDIYTGAYKQLVLPTSQKELSQGLGHKVSFDYQNRYPVPNMLWKLIHYKEKNEGIIFIFHNDPYYRADRSFEKKSYCLNICKIFGWKVENEVSRLGDTYCCDPRDFFARNPDYEKFQKFFQIENVLRLPLSEIDTDSD